MKGGASARAFIEGTACLKTDNSGCLIGMNEWKGRSLRDGMSGAASAGARRYAEATREAAEKYMISNRDRRPMRCVCRS